VLLDVLLASTLGAGVCRFDALDLFLFLRELHDGQSFHLRPCTS